MWLLRFFVIVQEDAFRSMADNGSCEYYVLYVFDEWLLMKKKSCTCIFNGKQSSISVMVVRTAKLSWR